MDIQVELTSNCIPKDCRGPSEEGAGAVIEFCGTVRGTEDGRTISGLEYEAYSPMAERTMRQILEELSTRHPCVRAKVIHRVGMVPVGEAAIYVGVTAVHRGEALALVGAFMDRLKQEVPIWKVRAIEPGERSVQSLPKQPPGATSAYSASTVIDIISEACSPLATEEVDLVHAVGRVLREPVFAPEDQPAFDRSSVDGYAIRTDDSSEVYEIVDRIRAGEWKPRQFRTGDAVQIATGGALPSQGLQVVMKEDAQAEGTTLRIGKRDGESNIRFQGEDARSGQVLVQPGTLLRAGAIGLLASLGCARPTVSRLPRVVHLATGNEIVPLELTPGNGQIRDSNSPLVRAFLASRAIMPLQQRIPEDFEAAERAVSELCSDSVNLLLISGGASVGEHDFTRALLERTGFQILVSKTTARPGKPLIVARRRNTLALGLPGNPLAHYVCLNLYARTALNRWSGQTCGPLVEQGVLGADLDAGGHNRQTFWPACWHLAEGLPILIPLKWCSSGDLTALATANALICVEPGSGLLARGARLNFVCTETLS